MSLLGEGQNQAAREQLEWCAARNPDDREIAEALQSLRIDLQDEVNRAE